MASRLAFELEIGVAVDSALGAVFSMIEDRLWQLQSRVAGIGEVIKTITPYAVGLGDSIRTAQERGSASAVEWLGGLEKISKSLNDQSTAVGQLRGQYQLLGQTVQQVAVQSIGLQKTDHGAALIGYGDNVLKAAQKPMDANDRYKAVVSDLTIKDGKSRDAEGRTAQEQNIAKAVKSMGEQSGMGKIESISLIQQMVDSGITLDNSLSLAPQAATYSVGQGVDGKDTALLFRSLQDAGVKAPKEVGEALKGIVFQAKNGLVGIGDISRMIPRLLPGLMAKGIEGGNGVDSAVRTTAMIQERGQTAGTFMEIQSDVKATIGAYSASTDKSANKAYGDQRFLNKDKQDGLLEADLRERRNSPDRKKKELDAAAEDLAVNAGDAIQPTTDFARESLTTLAHGASAVVDALKPVINVAAAMALAFVVVTKGASLFRGGKAVVDTGRGLFRRGSPGDGASGGKSSALGGAARRLFGVEEPKSATLARSNPPSTRVVATGFGRPRASTAVNSASARTEGEQTSARQQDPENAKAASMAQAKSASDTPDKKTGSTEGSPQKGTSLSGKSAGSSNDGFLSRMVAKAGKFVPVLNRIPGGRFLGAGLDIARTAMGAGNPLQKAVAYTQAAGGLSGAVAGAAAGAALLSFVPGVGTAIGAAVGGLIGGAGGEAGFAWIGERLFGSSEKPAVAATDPQMPDSSAPVAQGDVVRSLKEGAPPVATLPAVAAAAASVPGIAGTTGAPVPAASPPPANVAFTLNMPVTVQGSAENPTLLTQTVEPMVRRAFLDIFNQSRGGNDALYDSPSVAHS